MNARDFAPLFRGAIGFDSLPRLIDAAAAASAGAAYPPYNIEKTGDGTYVLTMAVAGFGPEDISLTSEAETLTVVAKAQDTGNPERFLHRGISGRSFERRFALASHIVVEGAKLENGLLQVELRRVVPEALRPRRIEIGQAKAAPALTAAAPEAA